MKPIQIQLTEQGVAVTITSADKVIEVIKRAERHLDGRRGAERGDYR